MASRRAARVGTVRRTTVDSPAEQNRCQVGPQFCSTTPGPGSPAPPFNRFLLGRPLCGDECRAEVRWVREHFNVARRQVPTVRKRRTEKKRWRPGGRPGPESVHSTTLATLAEQNRCQVGPQELNLRLG
jgi:hypothetical protein